MVNTHFAIGGLLSAKLGDTHATANFALGTRVEGNNNSTWVYVQAAAGGVTQYDCVHINSAYTAAPISTANATVAGTIGAAQVAIASAEYGWVMMTGKGVVRLAASCLDDVNLYTSNTPGVLDDATATLSHFLIRGLAADGSASGGGVTAVTCMLAFPVIRRVADVS